MGKERRGKKRRGGEAKGGKEGNTCRREDKEKERRDRGIK